MFSPTVCPPLTPYYLYPTTYRIIFPPGNNGESASHQPTLIISSLCGNQFDFAEQSVLCKVYLSPIPPAVQLRNNMQNDEKSDSSDSFSNSKQQLCTYYIPSNFVANCKRNISFLSGYHHQLYHPPPGQLSFVFFAVFSFVIARSTQRTVIAKLLFLPTVFTLGKLEVIMIVIILVILIASFLFLSTHT